MSSANAKTMALATRIRRMTYLVFGTLFLTSSAMVLGFTLKDYVREYHHFLRRLCKDLKGEYQACHGDPATMNRHFAEDVEEHGEHTVFLLLSSANGKVLTSHSHSPAVTQALLARANPQNPKRYRLYLDKDGNNGHRMALRVRRLRLADGNFLSVAYNVTGDERHITRIIATLVSASLLFLFLVLITARSLTRILVRPLNRIAEATRRIADGNYSERVPETAESTEIHALQRAFNSMCEQNERTLTELRTLTDNIAHDLRTPLTRLRAAAELAATDGPIRRPLAETVSQETTDMLDLINTMLAISQTDAQVDRTPRETLDLAPFVKSVAELYSVLAENKGQRLVVQVPESPILFSGHKGKLQQLFGNLLDNAIKFTPKGGSITVSLKANPVVLTVANTGPGISAKDLPNVFKRFWRADSSRSLPGNGLGLALAKAIATSYGASLSCTSENGLTTFSFEAHP